MSDECVLPQNVEAHGPWFKSGCSQVGNPVVDHLPGDVHIDQ